MQNNIKEKLNNLNKKFNFDLDIISLKALCNMPENEETSFAIAGILQRLLNKYPNDKEILELFPKKEKISLEELIKILEKKYSRDTELITLEALFNIPGGEDKEKAIKNCLIRILNKYPDDENITEYLGYEKSLDSNLVLVKGGSYTPSFFYEEKKVTDLYVSKYQVTQNEWEKYMKSNPSEFKGGKRPVEQITWLGALEFCNKISKEYGLQPVYKIENNKLTRIIYKNREEAFPNTADFSKTEGYRLPTELEWEWFARGGEVAIQNETFDATYSGSEKIEEIGWYRDNSKNQTRAVGIKKPNKLGLYDCSGNVFEWCYDTNSTWYNDITSKGRLYKFDEKKDSHILRGGSWNSGVLSSVISFRTFSSLFSNCYGLRIVRTK